MEVNPLGGSVVQAYQSSKVTEMSTKEKAVQETVLSNSDSYIPSDGSQKKVTYNAPQVKSIQKLKAESEASFSNLKQLVHDLLLRQGYTEDQIKNGQLKEEDIKIDDQARTEAQALIAPGGEMSSENISDRIVEFAKSVSNGDKSKLETLKNAIKEGFEQAKSAFGGQLPGICDDTYKLIGEKLDKWEKESDSTGSNVETG